MPDDDNTPRSSGSSAGDEQKLPQLTERLPIGSLSVSRLCLGGNVFGWTADAAASFDVLDTYIGAGGNFIDTADVYMAGRDGNTGGESESIIGDWLAARGNRDSVTIATKVGALPQRKGLSAANIKAAAEDSLRRLRTDHIDLYYTHFDDESVEVSEIITALDELVREGKVREIGASNLSPERLAASLDFSAESGSARYTALQPHYNLVSRGTYEGALAGLAERHDLAVMPYFALGAGFLTGKYRPGDPVEGARANKVSEYAGTEQGQSVLRALETVATARGASQATIALAWLSAQPTVTAPIASARKLEQLPALLAIDEVKLTPDEVDILTTASA